MGQRQDFFKEAVYRNYRPFKHDKLSASDLERTGLLPVVTDIYQSLGGQYDKPPLNYGPWDIPTSDFIIELDEERHFNRYRMETLSSDFYTTHNPFPLSNYREYCKGMEQHCLSAAKWGKNWKNDSTEKMFPQSNADGDLSGNGSSRWRQRAFYDFLKDITSGAKGIPVIRVSIYDRFRHNTINEILKKKDLRMISDFINELKYSIL